MAGKLHYDGMDRPMITVAYRKRADDGAWLFTEDPGPEPHEWEALYAQARDWTQKELREAARQALAEGQKP